MKAEQLQYFYADSIEGIAKQPFLDTISLEELISCIRNTTGNRPQLPPKLTIASLKNGFNLEITGGGIFKISEQSKNKSVILKVTPSFKSQQDTMLKLLVDIGEKEFAQILAKYPSNLLTQREIYSYLYLRNQDKLRIPQLYLGILNKLTEEAWIFIEDLSQLTKITAEKLATQDQIISSLIRDLASFHSLFWEANLHKEIWLGRWWNRNDNDFNAKDVNDYALERVIQLHKISVPEKVRAFLKSYLNKRQIIQSTYQEQPQTVIHWDAGPHNMLFDTVTHKATVFDWELTSYGLPQWDLAQFLLPIYGAKEKEYIYHYINLYLSSLPQKIQASINKRDFLHYFDLVVLDHFFRVCGPIIFAGKNIDKSSPIYIEWKNCLSWITHKLINKEKKVK